MTLPASGAISLSAVNTELGLTSTANTSLNSPIVRDLFAKQTGTVLLSDGYSKNAGWVARESKRVWSNIASSSDGRKLLAVSSTGIYTSTDSGLTWTNRANGFTGLQGCASSSDGVKLAVCDWVDGGYIYISADSGASWTARGGGLGVRWFDVAMSSDGIYLVATCPAALANASRIYTSSDSGVNWTLRKQNGNFRNCAVSSDGSRQLVCEFSNGDIYTSADYGVSWSAKSILGEWGSAASSASGNVLLVGESKYTTGRLLVSIDFGATWTTKLSGYYFIGSSMSDDGAKIIATTNSGYVYTSTDTGANWAQRLSVKYWRGCASSSDGAKVCVSANGDYIYTNLKSGA